ncbi:MAG: transcriptional regulator [Actinobacteria bacterium]|uniref:Unannotated protein n=1 Tax=freshwater metagenome TaxID=449393 RepID=A0A6J6GR69_9ZZZZ|nr:transcriptional regulator [Actinomycetota bacterium]
MTTPRTATPPRHRGPATGPNATGPNATGPNAIGAALGLLGDEWRLLIVRSAFEGARRYVDWKERLPVSDAVLTARLRSLVDGGVLRRVPAAIMPGRHEYELTAAGRDLWVLLLTIWDWERRHVAGQADRLPSMVHTDCTNVFHPVACCAACRSAVELDDVTALFGPSGGFARSVPVGAHRRRSGRRTTPGDASASPASDAGPGLFPDTMAVIGNRWSAAVVGAAVLGARRFRDFERALGVPPTVLTERLRSFVALGVLDDDGAAYRLTTKGAALFSIVIALVAWGERWVPAADGPAVLATHVACGAPFVPAWSCSECGGELRRDTIGIVGHPIVERSHPH